MKRAKLIKHLEEHGCTLKRHGNKHDIYANEALNTQTTIPRHPDIKDLLCKEICKQLGISKI